MNYALFYALVSCVGCVPFCIGLWLLWSLRKRKQVRACPHRNHVRECVLYMDPGAPERIDPAWVLASFGRRLDQQEKEALAIEIEANFARKLRRSGLRRH